MKSWRKSCAVLLTALLLAGNTSPVLADELDDKLESLQNQAAEQQKKTD